MLQCLRQSLTNGGSEGMPQGQAAPRRAPGAVLKELEQAVGSRQTAGWPEGEGDSWSLRGGRAHGK